MNFSYSVFNIFSDYRIIFSIFNSYLSSMNPVKRFLLLYFFLFGFLTKPISAQVQDRFDHLTIKDGLSHSIIFSIVQDKKGFIWLATQDGGLNKYDGYKFTVFENDPNNSNSLAANNVSKLLCDKKGNIWIGTWGGGLDKYDPITETFTHYRHNAADTINPSKLSHDNAQSLLEDSKGNIWIGTAGGGLNKLNASNGKITVYQFDENDSTSLNNDRVWSMAEDWEGNIWVGTSDGLAKLNTNTGKFTRYLFGKGQPGKLSHPKVRAVHIDKKRRIWIGTTVGLDLFDPATGIFTNYKPYPTEEEKAETNEVNIIYTDKQGGIWIGTHAGGLCKFNFKKKSFTKYIHNNNDEYSISYDDIRDIVEDRSGILWIATRGAGVNKFNLKPAKFMHYAAHPEDVNHLLSNRVRAICPADENSVWIGTDGGGLSKFNLKKGSFKNYINNETDKNSLSSNRVRTVYKDEFGNVWIGTDGSGLNLLNETTNTISRFENNPNDENSLIDNDILYITGGKDNSIWIGTDNGMDLFDIDKNQFTHFFSNPDDSTTLSNNRVWSIFVDSKGLVWAGTDDGLNCLDPTTGKCKQYKVRPGKNFWISNNDIYAITEDKDHNLWVGTGRGLNFFERKTERFTYYTNKHGLPGNSVYSIQIDEKNELWISTLNGLANFNPKTKKFKNYFSHDGLQSNEFLPGAGTVLESGFMFFGGINGFNAFHPIRIFENTFKPQIVFTGISIHNEMINLGKESILKQSVNYTESITLSYDQNEISISFAALSYHVSSENQYAYKLEGFDDDWIMVGKKQEATYTNLSPGKYTFRVKACNNDGAWNEEGIAMEIVITPPFWQTVWFYILCVVVFGLLVFAFIKWRIHKLKAANKILEDKVTVRTQKINEQNNILTAQREELEDKHRDIMDSIKYAKRIQEAILPPKHVLEENIKEHFVLYKPKDIVSGDFYWTEEHDGKVMVAAVDCTGHGVPGAFVSIVGSNGLNRAVNEFKLTRPALILDKLNFLVTDSLHQGETEGKDGMDMALCCLDREKGKVYFSGANNSLYVVSNKLQAEKNNIVHKLDDNRIMYELKADKQPIGGESSYKQTPFTHHEIDLIKGDMIYLFTDGFADQFGGAKGKKFKYANLFKLLSEISLFAMENQKEKLNFAFEDWKKDLEQLDDVCVIGIRV